MSKASQPSFFTRGEDTPLFSGVAPKVYVKRFDPQPEPEQIIFPCRCRLCRDTGLVHDASKGKSVPCWCEAGQKKSP